MLTNQAAEEKWEDKQMSWGIQPDHKVVQQ